MSAVIPAARPLIGEEERAAVDRVLRSGMIAQGPEVAAFEEEFGSIVGRRPCVAVSSGTSALHLGLVAAGVRPGDEIIVPSFTFAATANSVALAGATPVFVDIEPDQFALDPAAVEAAVSSRTAGIMPVHLYGHPARVDTLRAIADRHGLALFEDAAQAHAATWQGRPVGTFGTFGAFSFYPTKNMTTGEGGIVVCENEDLARRVRLLRNQGMERRYANEVVGFNARMTDIAAAIGRVQLRKLAGWTAARRANAAFFDAHLDTGPGGVIAPPVVEGAMHVYHQYTIRAADRDGLARRLADAGIGTGVYYPIPNHRLPAYDLRLDLPETERAAREVLSLPIHPALTGTDLEQIVTAVNKAAHDTAAFDMTVG